MSEDFSPVKGRFAAGSRIAGYLLEEQIGEGGMAVVFRAHDDRLDRRVALKILSPALAADEAFRQRFIRESRAAAAVDDPHIIPVFEAGEADGVLFIAMRYVRGGDVLSLASDMEQLPPERAADIVSQVASALDAAHANGLVHRDVKPANMLLDASGGDDRPDHVYLSDFGLSKGTVAASRLTATGQFLGTLAYIAPEQIEGKPVDGRADQYALACTAFELLSGTPPFQRDGTAAMMYAQLFEPPPTLTSRRPELRPDADQVLARALAKIPADRYASCREFANALRQALGLTARDSGPGIVAAALTDRPPTLLADRAAVDGAAAVTTAKSASPKSAGPDQVTGEAYIPVRPAAAAGVGVDGAGVGSPAGIGVAGAGGPGPGYAGPGGPGPGYPGSGGPGPGYPGPVGPGAPVAGWTAPQPVPPPHRPRQTPIILVGVCILVAAGVIAGAILARSSGSGKPGPAAVGNTGLASQPSTGASSHPSSSSSPGSTGPAGNGTTGPAGSGTASAGGYHYVSTLSPALLPGASMTAVTWNPTGTLVATSDKDGNAYIWDIATGRPDGLPLTVVGAGKAYAAAFSPDGKTLAVGYKNGSTYLWNVATGGLTATLPDPGGVAVDSVAFSPDGSKLVTTDENHHAYVWDISSGRSSSTPSRVLSDPAGEGVWSAAFSAQGVLATGDYAGNVYLWNAATGQPTGQFVIPGGVAVSALAFSPDGSVLAAGNETGSRSGSGSLYLLGVAGQRRHFIYSAGSVWALSFTGRTLAMADGDGRTYLWHVNAASLSASPIGAISDPGSGTQGVGAMAFSDNGQWLVTGDTNGRAYAWKVG